MAWVPEIAKSVLAKIRQKTTPSLSRTRDRDSTLPLAQLSPEFGLGEFRRHLYLLARRDPQIVACGPDLVVDQHLERDRVLRHSAPTPCLGVHTVQWQPAFPSQAGTLASQENDIAKTDIPFDVNDGQCRGAPGRARPCGACPGGARCWRARHCRPRHWGARHCRARPGGFCPGNACACGTGSGCAGSSYAGPHCAGCF